MPFLSVIVPTMRVGGVSLLIDSLAKQTFTDFELVLVDAIHDHRKDLVIEKARDRFVAVKHCCPKPSPFPLCSYCLMMNVGIAMADGEVLLFAADYTSFPPDILEKHARFHREDTTGKAGMMAPYRYTKIDVHPEFPAYGRGDVDKYEADVKSGALDRWMLSIGKATDQPSEAHEVDGGGRAPSDCDAKLRLPAGSIGFEYFHAKNESVRREHVLAINGFDEDLDGTHLYQDSDFADRIVTKAGVTWTLDPTAVLDIANPRHVFPFARRVRDFRDNERIWQEKRARGYPGTPKSILVDLKRTRATAKPKRQRIAMVYGEFSSFHQPPFVAADLFVKRGMSGSELSFFNLARTLAESGEDVVVFCKTPEIAKHDSGFTMFPIQDLEKFGSIPGVDAFITWNEPDYLRFAPPGAVRIFNQQLNDFAYTHSGWYHECGTWLGTQPPDKTPWGSRVDVYVAPSEETVRWHRAEGGIGTRYPIKDGAIFLAIHNTCDLDFYSSKVTRHPHRAIWASSPDRGLHNLLAIWPDVRRRVPDAELKIYYEVGALLERLKDVQDENGRRARYIASALPWLERMGVSVMGFVPNEAMAKEYQAAAVMPYTCEPTRHTETFAGAVLDACAGGCWPIITDADCLPSVYKYSSDIIPGKPLDSRSAWVDKICQRLTRCASAGEAWAMEKIAGDHVRRVITKQWVSLIREARA